MSYKSALVFSAALLLSAAFMLLTLVHGGNTNGLSQQQKLLERTTQLSLAHARGQVSTRDYRRLRDRHIDRVLLRQLC